MNFITRAKSAAGLAVVSGAFILLTACTSVTTNSCSLIKVQAENMPALIQAAASFEQWLNRTGQEVVIIARTGQDLSRHGIQFSHAAFAKKEENQWVVYHLLNSCPINRGALFKEDLIQFLTPAKNDYQVAVIAPLPEIQNKLSILLEDEAERNSVFDERYNAVGYPFSNLNQNSNGWVLEFFSKAVADSAISSRDDAIAWLISDHYQPALIEIGSLKQFAAEVLVGNASIKGQPLGERREGKIWMSSGDSVLNYIAGYSIKLIGCVDMQTTLDKNVCIVRQVSTGN